MSTPERQVPLLLLDVDGVLNALGDDKKYFDAWPEWCAGYADADGTRWLITWAPAVAAQLRTRHENGTLELQWLTTWGHDANGELRALIDLPKLAVAGTYDDPEGGSSAARGESHAAAAPSAPDLLSGRWWKYDVVRRWASEQPDRLIMWVDDELHDPTLLFRLWADEQPNVLPVGPDPMVGLAGADLTVISRGMS